RARSLAPLQRAQVKLDLRITGLECAHEAGRGCDGRGVEADPQAVLLAARLDVDVGKRLRVDREHAPPAPQQRLAGGGQLHAARGPPEQLDAELSLEGADRGAERRLSD